MKSHTIKNKRNTGPDREGLIVYKDPLKIWINAAPYCFPGFVNVP